MAPFEEVALNAANVGLSIAILGLLVLNILALHRRGRDLAIADLYLRERRVERVGLLLAAGLALFLLGNVVEAAAFAQSSGLVAGEVIETAALAFVAAGLGVLLPVWRAAKRVAPRVERPPEEGA